MSALIRTAKTHLLKAQFMETCFSTRKIWAITNQLRCLKGQQSIDDLIIQSFSSDTEDIMITFSHLFVLFSGENKDDDVVCTKLQELSIAYAFFASMEEIHLRSLIFSMNSRKSAGLKGRMVDELRRHCDSVKRVLRLRLNGISTAAYYRAE